MYEVSFKGEFSYAFFLKGQMCMGSTEIEFNNNKKCHT